MPIKYPITDEDTVTEEKFVNFLIKTFNLDPIYTNFSNLLSEECHQKGQVNFLMIAASRGYYKLSSCLAQDNLTRINDKDCTGYTALMAASQDGYIDIVHILLELGADRTIRDKLGNTAFDYVKANVIKHPVHEKQCPCLVPNLTLPNDDTDSDFDILGLPSNDSND